MSEFMGRVVYPTAALAALGEVMQDCVSGEWRLPLAPKGRP